MTAPTMAAVRRILVVTTSRADYSHVRWLLHRLKAHPAVDVKVVAFGPHLSPEFGRTVEQIAHDGVVVDETIESLLSSDTDVGMAKSLGLATLGLADTLGRLRPDLLVITADRYEMLAAAGVALTLRIPIAHIEGGELSEGAIDDAVRHALTKLSHLHFTTTAEARRRVLALGEEPWRVHQVGALSLDQLTHSALRSADNVARHLRIVLGETLLLVACHPETLERETTAFANAVFDALEQLPHQIVFVFPNADSGSRVLIDRARAFCAARANARLVVNLAATDYWSLLSNADVLIGNSSSGIMEAASLQKPAINVGIRQQGREHADNVIDVPAEPAAILTAVSHVLSPGFQQRLAGVRNPYGDGHAAERIVEVLTTTPLGQTLLMKRAAPLPAEP